MYDPLCTLEDVKLWLKSAQNVTVSDAAITALITPASEAVGRYCGRDNLGNVILYVERHPPKPYGRPNTKDPRVFLRRYPVVQLQSVTIGYNTGAGTSPIQVVTDPTAPTGAWLDEDYRTVWLIGYAWRAGQGPTVVTYTAGYYGPATAPSGTPINTPAGLRQVVAQWIAELIRSRDYIGQKSQTMAQQTTAYEVGAKLGMNTRTQQMLQPYINRVPAENY